jgi:hypothetical protein
MQCTRHAGLGAEIEGARERGVLGNEDTSLQRVFRAAGSCRGDNEPLRIKAQLQPAGREFYSRGGGIFPCWGGGKLACGECVCWPLMCFLYANFSIAVCKKFKSEGVVVGFDQPIVSCLHSVPVIFILSLHRSQS